MRLFVSITILNAESFYDEIDTNDDEYYQEDRECRPSIDLLDHLFDGIRECESEKAFEKCYPSDECEYDCPVAAPYIVDEDVCDTQDECEKSSEENRCIICHHFHDHASVVFFHEQNNSDNDKRQSPKLSQQGS